MPDISCSSHNQVILKIFLYILRSLLNPNILHLKPLKVYLGTYMVKCRYFIFFLTGYFTWVIG